MTFLCNQRGYVMTILLQWQIQGRGSRGGYGEPPPPPPPPPLIRRSGSATVLFYCNSVLRSLLGIFDQTQNASVVLEKISNKFHQGTLNHNNFLVIFEGIAKFSSFNPSPSLPSFATDNRIHFQCLNIVLSNKTGP